MPEVEATCDRILIINDGKIVADGSSEVLRKQAQGQEILKVEIIDTPSRDEVISGIQQLPTVAMVDPLEDNENGYIINSSDNQSSKRELFNLCVKKKWVLTELTPLETKLEDIFRDLTTN